MAKDVTSKKKSTTRESAYITSRYRMEKHEGARAAPRINLWSSRWPLCFKARTHGVLKNQTMRLITNKKRSATVTATRLQAQQYIVNAGGEKSVIREVENSGFQPAPTTPTITAQAAPARRKTAKLSASTKPDTVAPPSLATPVVPSTTTPRTQTLQQYLLPQAQQSVAIDASRSHSQNAGGIESKYSLDGGLMVALRSSSMNVDGSPCIDVEDMAAEDALMQWFRGGTVGPSIKMVHQMVRVLRRLKAKTADEAVLRRLGGYDDQLQGAIRDIPLAASNEEQYDGVGDVVVFLKDEALLRELRDDGIVEVELNDAELKELADEELKELADAEFDQVSSDEDE